MCSDEYNYDELLDALPVGWRRTLKVVLDKARQMQMAGEDGQIVILIKDNLPRTVRREDSTLIERNAA
jgi:hypothetical protein